MLRIGKGLACARGARGVQRLWLPNFGYSRDDLPGYADTFAGLVPCDVVDDHSEERRQRIGTATCVGLEELRNGVGHGCTNCVALWFDRGVIY
jgi:hypothetical protein